jgi:hypothetical protein
MRILKLSAKSFVVQKQFIFAKELVDVSETGRTPALIYIIHFSHVTTYPSLQVLLNKYVHKVIPWYPFTKKKKKTV